MLNRPVWLVCPCQDSCRCVLFCCFMLFPYISSFQMLSSFFFCVYWLWKLSNCQGCGSASGRGSSLQVWWKERGGDGAEVFFREELGMIEIKRGISKRLRIFDLSFAQEGWMVNSQQPPATATLSLWYQITTQDRDNFSKVEPWQCGMSHNG